MIYVALRKFPTFSRFSSPVRPFPFLSPSPLSRYLSISSRNTFTLTFFHHHAKNSVRHIPPALSFSYIYRYMHSLSLSRLLFGHRLREALCAHDAITGWARSALDRRKSVCLTGNLSASSSSTTSSLSLPLLLALFLSLVRVVALAAAEQRSRGKRIFIELSATLSLKREPPGEVASKIITSADISTNGE